MMIAPDTVVVLAGFGVLAIAGWFALTLPPAVTPKFEKGQ